MKIMDTRGFITVIWILGVIVSIGFLIFNIVVGSIVAIIVHTVLGLVNGYFAIDSLKGGKTMSLIISKFR